MISPVDVDLDACASEPIRIPGGIQPHGALLVLDPQTLRPIQASDNLAVRVGPSAELPGPLKDELRRWLSADEAIFLRTVKIGRALQQVTAHRTGQGVILDIEDPPQSESETLQALYPRLGAFVDQIGQAPSTRAIAEIAVKEMRGLTGFNRTMLYSFDDAGDGVVLAEDSDGALPSYLDLRFPSTDIPVQARELYRLNRLRLIPDARYRISRIEPELSPIDGRPLDLGLSSLRSVSPVHLEYMLNMGTAASMSVSILVDGQLWGLISCHNETAKGVNAQVRIACDFIGQIVSLQIGSRERGERARRRVEQKQVEARLLAKLSQSSNFRDGLVSNAGDWMGLVDARGAAVVTAQETVSVGSTPSTSEIEELTRWLHRQDIGDVFVTDCLSDAWGPAEGFVGAASGLVAIPISQLHPSYILWFREEVVREVKWGGDPRKSDGETGRLTPRQSFETWKELVRRRSRPWEDVEVESARDFRHAIVDIVLRRAEERAELTDQLQRSNAELEAFSYSVSHDLRAPFRHIVGYAELLRDRENGLDETSRHYLSSIVEAAHTAGRLVDDLLSFSHVGRTVLGFAQVDVVKLINEVRRSVQGDIASRRVEWRIGQLPPTQGDPGLLRQAFANLIDNAVKYTRDRDPAVITIVGEERDGRVDYCISDNGAGFDPAYGHKLFGVFQRLHRVEEFPGTGIGLALTKRIVERHGGQVAATGTLGRGASFTISLPKKPKAETLVGQPESHPSR